MFDIKIMVLDMQTNKEEKATNNNTFWDNGTLKGALGYLKIIYRIEGSEDEVNE